MATEPPPEGSIFTTRQLVQSLGQFVMSFAGTVGTMLAAGAELNTRSLVSAGIAALLVAGGVLGFSFAPIGKK